MKKSLKSRTLTLEKFTIAHLSDLQGDRILGGASTGCNATSDSVVMSADKGCTTQMTLKPPTKGGE